MKLSQLVLMPLVSARFDLGTVAEPTDPGLQCPPKDSCLITFNFLTINWLYAFIAIVIQGCLSLPP